MASMVSGSVGDISAPKYSVSRNVKLLLKYFGISFTQPYIRPPIRNADKVVPTMANVRIAPKLRKKYFCKCNYDHIICIHIYTYIYTRTFFRL